MAKSELTLKVESALIRWLSHNRHFFFCPEVTIGWYGKERVDFMSMDTEGTFRCYEVKVSVADFHSRNKNTFVGHLNYYVMPVEVYNKVSKEIPRGVGVLTYNGSINVEVVPKRVEPKVSIEILKNSLIRSLCREYMVGLSYRKVARVIWEEDAEKAEVPRAQPRRVL
jgi:hypothetical protein